MKKLWFFLALSFLITHQHCWAATCFTTNSGNWNSAAIWDCGRTPLPSEQAGIGSSNTVTLTSDISLLQLVLLLPTSILNAGSYSITLSNSSALSGSGTFNAGTSTVKFSDANHTVNSNITLYNWQWATSLTAPRTLTINSTVTNAGGTFNLDGSSATNTVSFAGTGTVTPALTVNNCAGNPGPVTGITCVAPPAAGYGSTPAIGNTLSISGATGSTPSSTLSISETGNSALNITGIAVTGTDMAKFTFSPTTLSIADGGAAQSVTVTCNGSVAGTFSATLNVAHNATGSPATYPLSCTITASGGGGGTPPPVQASVESDLAFALTFLGIALFAAFKMRRDRKT